MHDLYHRGMFEFQNHNVYKLSKELYRETIDIVEKVNMSKTMNYQLSRSALSVVLNISEGSGRFTRPDQRHFFVMARSSLFETIAIIDLLGDTGLVGQHDIDELYRKADSLSRILLSMIRKLS